MTFCCLRNKRLSRRCVIELFRRIQPHEYLSRFLAEGYRPDGRSVGNYEARQPAINVGSISSADGSALVKLGETTVLCGIRAEIAEPDLSSPRTGFLGAT